MIVSYLVEEIIHQEWLGRGDVLRKMNFFLLLAVIIATWNANWGADGFASQTILRNHSHRHDHQLAMALIPIGPFCPFRSSAAMENESSPKGFAEEFSKIQSTLQVGGKIDSDRLRKLADNMDMAIQRWEDLFRRLESTPDFGAREYTSMAEAHLKEHGTDTKSIALLIRWQSSCMRALAEKEQPPMPPQELDLQRLMDNETKQSNNNNNNNNKKPSISAMQEATMVTANPLDDEMAFESESMRDEYNQLVQDHSSLMEKGSNYENLAPSDKLTFLDLIELIQARWDSLLDRCEFSLSQEYIDQCQNYLKCMKLTEDEFRHLLRVSHRLMRQDAERELDKKSIE